MHQDSTASVSVISKSNTNLTNISPLASISNFNNSNLTETAATSSHYQRLANTPVTHSRQNFYNTNSVQLPFVNNNNNNNSNKAESVVSEAETVESAMSCQLITSSSLLLNREFVRQAQTVTRAEVAVTKVFDARASNRSNRSQTSTQTQTNEDEQQESVPKYRVVLNELGFEHDPSKPPPMETCI